LLERIIANEEAGMARDEAISAALEDIANNLNTTSEDLLSRLEISEESLVGLVEDFEVRLREDLATTEKNLIDLIEEKEAAGIERDEAINEAIDEIAADLNTTRRSNCWNSLG